ncbi:MAG: hypothetical protein ABJP34_04425 [Erythrobacter sp.]
MGMTNLPLRTAAIALFAACLNACATSPLTLEPKDQSSAHNSWALVDDFEANDALAGWTIFDADNQTDPFVANAQVSEIRTNKHSTGRFLLRKPAAEGVVGNRKALAWKPLPRRIAIGETATLFTRVNVEYFPNNHAFGLSNQDSAAIGKLAYDAFESMIRITDKAESDGTKNSGAITVLTGPKVYSPIGNPSTGKAAQPLKAGEWYDVWYVVNNARKVDGGQTYDLYVKGGEFASQTKVFSGATFRIGREQPLSHFVAITNTGPARAPYGNGGVRYDDIYIAAGQLLSDPVTQ